VKIYKNSPILKLLYGLTFISPVVFSTSLAEMDNLQKLIFSVLALVLFTTIILTYKNDEKEVYLNRYLLLVIVVFPFSFLTACINGSAHNLPLLFTNLLTPLCIILLTVLMLSFMGEHNFLKTISTSIVIISTLFAFIGLLESFNITLIQLPTMVPPGSTLGNRNFAVEYLIPSLPFILILKNHIKKGFNPLLIIAAFINISFILFTRSRSAFIILTIIVLLYFTYSFIKSQKSIKKLLPEAAILFLAVVFSLLSAPGAERTDIKESVGNIFNTDLGSSKSRITYWDASLKMISENSLTGVGAYKWSGNYPKYYGHRNDHEIKTVWYIHAHNDFLELYAENGPITPLLYLLLLFLILKILYVKSDNNRDYFYVLLSIVATGLFSFVTFPFYKFSSHFLLSVGIGLALYGNRGDGFKKNNISFKFLKLIFAFLIAVGLITTILKFNSEVHLIKGMDHLKNGKYHQVNMQLDKVSDVFYPFDASKQPIEYYRGIANYSIGKYSEALNNNLAAQKLSLFNPLIMGNLAASYQALGNFDKAIEIYENIGSTFPNYAEPQINLLYLYFSSGDTAKQQELYKILIKKYPSHPRLLKFRNLLSF